MNDYVTILVTLIGLLQAVSVAVIVGLFNRESRSRKKAHSITEKRAQIRTTESLLTMKLMVASNRLAAATGRAVRDGKTNGEMDKALTEAQKTQQEYLDFINNIAAEHMATD